MENTRIYLGGISSRVMDFIENNPSTRVVFLRNQSSRESKKYQTKIEPFLKEVYSVDYSNPEAFIRSVSSLNLKLPKDSLILLGNDSYFWAQGYLADHIGISPNPYTPIEIAEVFADKTWQRKFLLKNFPERTVSSIIAKDWDEVRKFATNYNYPVILKPGNLRSSALVYVCSNEKELKEGFESISRNIQSAYDKQKTFNTPKVICEEFIVGDQYSIDSYVSHDSKVTHTPMCRQVMGSHYGHKDLRLAYSTYPSGLDSDVEEKILSELSEVLTATGIKSAVVHSEIRVKFTAHGDFTWKIIEFNPRIGGFRNKLLKESYGIDHAENNIRLQKKLLPVLHSNIIASSAVPQIWSDSEGILKEVKGIDKVKHLKSFISIEDLEYSGEKTGPASLGYKRVVSFILKNVDRNQLLEDVDKVFQLVKPVVEEK